jgi:hypothetical protein
LATSGRESLRKGWSRKAQASVAFCVLKFYLSINSPIMEKTPVRYLIQKEIELGFLEVPLSLRKHFRTYKSHLSFVVDGKKRKLTYNPRYHRLFGLVGFYRKIGASPRDAITFIPHGNTTFEFRFGKRTRLDILGLPSRTKGNIVEERIGQLILLYGRGLLNTYKPISDIEGIDLVVFKKDSFLTLYRQVKSKYQLRNGNLFQIGVKQRGFRAHEMFYVVGAYFNPEKMDLDDRLILIPSKEFQKKAVKVRNGTADALYVLTTTLSPNHKSKFAKYIINKEQLVGNILEKFKEIETARRAPGPKLTLMPRNSSKRRQRPLLITTPSQSLESKLE